MVPDEVDRNPIKFFSEEGNTLANAVKVCDYKYRINLDIFYQGCAVEVSIMELEHIFSLEKSGEIS